MSIDPEREVPLREAVIAAPWQDKDLPLGAGLGQRCAEEQTNRAQRDKANRVNAVLSSLAYD